MKESGRQVNILSFENYRLSPKGELSENEIIAFKILLNQILREGREKNPFEESDEYSETINSKSYQLLQNEMNALENKLKLGEKVKTKLKEVQIKQRKLLRCAKRKYNNRIRFGLQNDPSSEYYKFTNAAHLRFGWAMTVHKSAAYKWDEIILDVDPGEKIGKSNEAHFRWLYTGITRAREKILLIHYKAITPQKKQKYYVWVLESGEQGITEVWADCEAHVKGVPNAKFKSFETKEEAEAWLAAGADYNLKHIAAEVGIYFDAGTGGGGNVRIRITDEKGEDLIDNVAVPEKITNNFGELLACKYALELALKTGVKNIFGDSDLIIEYWSQGKINKKTVFAEIIVLAGEVEKLRDKFERRGGKVQRISSGSNPADLGFHKI